MTKNIRKHLNWEKKNEPATNNNIMKMCMLTVGVNPNLVKKVFMDYKKNLQISKKFINLKNKFI